MATRPFCDCHQGFKRNWLELAKQFAEYDFDLLVAGGAGIHQAARNLTALGTEVKPGALKNKPQAAAGYAVPDPLVAREHAAMSAPGLADKK